MSKRVVIIGGGPGGYTAAIRLAQLGAKVTLVEKDSLGGTCLNRGCIPTKALVRSAEVLNTIKNSSEFGININSFEIDFQKIISRKNLIVKKLYDGILSLIKANKIDFHTGCGYIVDKNTVKVILSTNNSQLILETDYIIIATGSVPSIPPILGSNLQGILVSDTILSLEKLPESLTIVGGGIIGMEFASIFSSFGSKVIVVEFLDSILANIDSDIVKRVLPMFKKRGVEIHTGTKVASISYDNDNSSYTLSAIGKNNTQIEFKSSSVLFATGRKPYFEKLGLENVFTNTNIQKIEVDNCQRSQVDNIYAIGDATGAWMLAHTAAHEGIIAAHHIMNNAQNNSSHNIVPSCIFTFPEIASAGLTEDTAKKENIPYKTYKFMFGANGKALCLGEGEGFVKVIAGLDKKVLGVHIMGPHASDLIQEAVLAIQKEISTYELSNIIHAHPTLSEALAESFMGLEDLAIHGMPI